MVTFYRNVDDLKMIAEDGELHTFRAAAPAVSWVTAKGIFQLVKDAGGLLPGAACRPRAGPGRL